MQCGDGIAEATAVLDVQRGREAQAHAAAGQAALAALLLNCHAQQAQTLRERLWSEK